MALIDHVNRPSKEEQEVAVKSYDALKATLARLESDTAEIEIEETKDRLTIPLSALEMLVKILKATSEGLPISVVPVAMEVTTQKAADLLGCSRPHIVKLLQEGKIPFTKVGKHRRIKYDDLIAYQRQMEAEQKALLIDIMQSDEEDGLYDT